MHRHVFSLFSGPLVEILPSATCEFFHQLVVFHGNLCVKKSFRVSWTLLSILADLIRVVILLLSPGLFSVSFPGLRVPFEMHKPQLVSPSSSWCSTAFFRALAKIPVRNIFLLLIFNLWSAETVKSTRKEVLLSCLLTQGFTFLLGLDDLFTSENNGEFYGSHYQGQILICVYIIW